MARKNNVDASVTITFNGVEAEKVMDKLRNKAEKLRSKIAELKQAAVPDTKSITELEKKLKDVEKTIKTATSETKKYEETLKKLDTASIKELTAAQRTLLAQIKKLKPGSDEFVQATQQYKQVTARIKSVESAYKQVDETQKNMFRRIASGMNRYFLMASTAIATVTGLSMKLRDVARQAAELDDKMAQVMKTTGLTHEQVENLNEAFKKMDTRTTIEQLNDLAYQAGKLGFNTVESVQQFVEAADIINIALGDVLGDNATLEIAKLAQVYSQSTDLIESKDLKGKMMAVGSAINQLGKESTASESYMVDFLGRLGGVATQAGLSADQILGYASALDQMKQKVEMSATAFQKLIQQMIKKPEEFVKAAQMPLEDFKNLMETDMNAAIKRVLAGFNEMGGFQELVPIFKDMGLDGARAASVVASLASNLDLVSAAQETANEHIALGTSMLREFNIMNESDAAKLEKRRNELHEQAVVLGQKLTPALLHSTKAVNYIIRALAEYGKEIGTTILSIAALTLVIKAHTIIHGVWNGILKIGNALKATGVVLANAAKLAYYKLTGATKAAAAAQQALNAAMSASVFGIIALAVGALTFAITRYINKQREANELQEQELSLEGKIKSQYAEQSAEIGILTGIVNDETVSYDKRNDALQKLKELVPEYHASLTEEGKLINNNVDAIDRYLNKLLEETRMKAYQDKLIELQTAMIETQELFESKEKELEDFMNLHIHYMGEWTYDKFMSQMNKYSDFVGEDAQQAAKVLHDQAEEYKSTIKNLEKDIDDILSKIKQQVKKASPIVTVNVQFKTYEDALADLEKEQAEIVNQIKRDYINRKITQDEYQEAMRDANLDFLTKKLDLTRQYGEDETKVMAAWLDAQVEANKLADKEIEDARKKAEQEAKKAEEEALRERQRRLNELTRLADRFKKELLNPIDEYREEVSKLEEIRNERLIDEEQYQQMLLNIKKKYAEKSQKEVKDLDELGIFERYQLEKDNLAKLQDEGLLSWQDYEKEVAKLRIEYARKTAEQISNMLGHIGDFITSLRDMEMAQAEAQYQKDLTAAGDNAEERERIEAEYEQKQLDIKKKYADTDMAINIAKATAEGALAIARAFADMPYPAAIVVSALIAATTAAQIATIIAQRNAIKNASVNSTSSSGGGTQNYGDRVLNGMKRGGYAEADESDDTPMGVYHANEYISPAWLVRKEPVLFRNLEEYRQTGHRPALLTTQGMKDGGFAGTPAPQQIVTSDPAMAAELARLSKTIDKLVSNGVQSYLVYNQYNDFLKQRNRFKKITSLKS